MPYGCKLSVNKCFLAKSPVGSLPFVHREISHCGEIQGSRADAKQMRGKRNSAGSTARDAAQGNLARLILFLEARETMTLLAPPMGVRKRFLGKAPVGL